MAGGAGKVSFSSECGRPHREDCGISARLCLGQRILVCLGHHLLVQQVPVPPAHSCEEACEKQGIFWRKFWAMGAKWPFSRCQNGWVAPETEKWKFAEKHINKWKTLNCTQKGQFRPVFLYGAISHISDSWKIPWWGDTCMWQFTILTMDNLSVQFQYWSTHSSMCVTLTRVQKKNSRIHSRRLCNSSTQYYLSNS